MSEEEEGLDQGENEDLDEEKAELEKLGVSSTFGLLSQKEDKKKEEEKKLEFRGFK